MKKPKVGDWIKLYPKSNSAQTRIDINGHYWVVETLLEEHLKLRSSEKTFGPPKQKRYDGMIIWLENDPNYEWML